MTKEEIIARMKELTAPIDLDSIDFSPEELLQRMERFIAASERVPALLNAAANPSPKVRATIAALEEDDVFTIAMTHVITLGATQAPPVNPVLLWAMIGLVVTALEE